MYERASTIRWQSFSIMASRKDVARKSEYANSPIAPMAPTHSLIIPHMVLTNAQLETRAVI